MEEKINPLQIDALREMVNIGAGNAATALSQMIKKFVNIDIPQVTFCEVEKAPSIIGDPQLLVAAIYLELLGDASGVILFSFPKLQANRLADILLGKPAGTTRILNEIGQSAIKETATILVGAYLNAISKLLGLRLLTSAPGFAEDMAGAIIENVLVESGKDADKCFVVNTDLMIVEEKINAVFFFIPDKESLNKIFHLMKVNN